jgi:Ni,Fe-hydrogenase III small subunit/NAD-dependent dihydropyrimidine dehydrogenase PreA subunit
MLKILLARAKQGYRTSSYPSAPPTLPDRFRGAPKLEQARCRDSCATCIEACPTDALRKDGGAGSLQLDMGRCLFCTDCVSACPEGAIAFTQEHRLAARVRDDLLVADGFKPRAKALNDETRRLFGRSLKLRVVSAGGCNGCEADVNVLGTVVFDAIPSPKIVIAVGACAISGGPYAGHPEVHDGVQDLLPVDLYVPGCPPHPFTILDGLLGLLGRMGPAPTAP